jgi:hypothetical protein
MQSKIKELQQALEGFVQQSRRSVLVISLEESELVYVLKLIETLDQQDKANVYGSFPQPVDKGSGAYADEVSSSGARQSARRRQYCPRG